MMFLFDSNCENRFFSWVAPITSILFTGVPYLRIFELFSAGNAVNPCTRLSSTNNASAPRWESEDATGANENSNCYRPFF